MSPPCYTDDGSGRHLCVCGDCRGAHLATGDRRALCRQAAPRRGWRRWIRRWLGVSDLEHSDTGGQAGESAQCGACRLFGILRLLVALVSRAGEVSEAVGAIDHVGGV